MSAASNVTYLIVHLYNAPQRKRWLHSARCMSSATTPALACGGPLELTTPGDCDWIIGVDLMGTIYGCQTFLPHIKAQGEGGHIVSTASLSGLIPLPGIAVHSAAKAAIIALSQTLAAELAGTSIGVSVLLPGFMRTRIADREHTARNRPKRFGQRPRLHRRVRTN